MEPTDPTPTPPAGEPPATGIQTTPEAPAPAPVPLPPPSQPRTVSPEKFARACGRLDAVLAVLVVGLAFLVASTPVNNPDFFRQLAVGRLLLSGDYPFGTDPFTYAADDTYWPNHSWLFALLVHGLYHLPAGGAVVVVVKALLVAVLAGLMLGVGRREGQSLWIPACCTALAVLALGPRLYLQSTVLSFVFLGLTLYLLTAIRYPLSATRSEGPEQADGGQPIADSGKRIADSGKRRWWLLPPLFVLWVNCDQWFILGPLTVALYLAGELLDSWLSPPAEGARDVRRRELGTLGLVLLVGLAACLLNPHHVRAFALPTELGLSAGHDALQNDPQFRPYFLSPLRESYYDERVGLSVAGLAFAPLMLLGLASFVLLYGRTPGWRLPVWLGFALLALYNARTIPFFAVVAGPITALNWLDYAAGRLGPAPRLTAGWRAWSLGGRALTILLAVALLAATVPGWIHARPYEGHRVGWRVKVDPSLEQAALQIKRWRDEGRLPAEPHWFCLHQEVASYLAWFAPGERIFIDPALPQFAGAADDYRAVREALEDELRDDEAEEEATGARKDWRAVLRKRQVRYWIYDQSAVQRAEFAASRILFRPSTEWRLCYLHGRVAVFAWYDPQTKEGPAPSPGEVDLKGRAYGPDAEQAPPQGPAPAERPREWWEAWWRPAPPVAVDRETARLYEVCFLMADPVRKLENARAWQAAVAAWAVASAPAPSPAATNLLALALGWGRTYNEILPAGARGPVRAPLPREFAAMRAQAEYTTGQDAGPPEALYLGVRAARRALSANPEDAQTYLLLGQAYDRLGQSTRERFHRRLLPQLAEIRRTQMTAAYVGALRYGLGHREAAVVHERLFNLFAPRPPQDPSPQLAYIDVAAHHLREGIQSIRAAGPQPGEATEDFNQRLEKLDRQLESFEDEVKRRQDKYIVTAANRPAPEKVRNALAQGLAETAIQALNESSAEEFSTPQGQALAVRAAELLLDLGRLDGPDGASQVLTPEGEGDQPSHPSFLNARVRLAAARGDYAAADRLLADALARAWKDPRAARPAPQPGEQIADRVGRALLSEALHAGGVPRLPLLDQRLASEFWVRRDILEALEAALFAEAQRADLNLLRGWLALEAGRGDEARRHLRTAAEAAPAEEAWVPAVNGLNALLGEIQMLQEMAARQAATRAWARHYLKWLN